MGNQEEYRLYEFNPTFEKIEKTLYGLILLRHNNARGEDLRIDTIEKGIEFLDELQRRFLYEEGFVFKNSVFLDKKTYSLMERYEDLVERKLKEIRQNGWK